MNAKKSDPQKKTLRVKQIRSGIGCTQNMRDTLKGMGVPSSHIKIDFFPGLV